MVFEAFQSKNMLKQEQVRAQTKLRITYWCKYLNDEFDFHLLFLFLNGIINGYGLQISSHKILYNLNLGI